MKFTKYQHVERFGRDEVDGIEIGKCYVQPKLDGSNGSVWLGNDNKVYAGSRNRELTLDNDNQGFFKYITENDKFAKFLNDYPNYKLVGEWLILHSLATYREDAWQKFYVFDVIEHLDDDNYNYLTYEDYQPLLEKYGIEYVPVQVIIENGKEENFVKELDKNTFLIQDGKGYGEGIIIKNYSYKNKYGRTVWAKIVRNEFKEQHFKISRINKIDGNSIEQKIIDDFFTKDFVKKEYAKLFNENNCFNSKMIAKLLGIIWFTFIDEEIWNIIKKLKNPKIDFNFLHRLVIEKTKNYLPEVF